MSYDQALESPSGSRRGGRPQPSSALAALAALAAVAALAALAALSACGSGGSNGDPPPPNGGDAELVAVHFGQLADVYGLVGNGTGLEQQLYRRDVIYGPDIRDEVQLGRLGSGEPRYDFLAPDPDTLQVRILIVREVGTADFDAAFAALSANLALVTPTSFERPERASLVPRNATLRLSFDRDVGVGDDFFAVLDNAGNATAVRNNTAVQLLELGGLDARGEVILRPVPVRVRARGRELVVDPVLLGSEALAWSSPNNAAGMPASAVAGGANMRLALPLAGDRAIPGLRPSRLAPTVGTDLTRNPAIIRDFRSGNRQDNTPRISRGFVRDGTRPRLIGELPMRLAAVDRAGPGTLQLRVFKNGIEHELDVGDTLRVETAAGGPPLRTELVTDPDDDRYRPAEQFVDVRVREVPRLLALDPRRQPGYPADPQQLPDWLDANAPIATLVAPFQAARTDPASGAVSRDDPRWFVSFEPGSLDPDAALPTAGVQVFAGAVLRFSKPMDLDSMRPLDTVFFATRDTVSPAALTAARQQLGIPASLFDVDKFRTPHLIGSRLFDEDGTRTVLRLQPILGFYLDATVRQAAAAGTPFETFLQLVAGSNGVSDLSGQPLDLESDEVERNSGVVVPFTLDARDGPGGPAQPDNVVAYVCSRMTGPDEDARPSYYLADEAPTAGAPTPRNQSVDDLFGNHVLIDGRLVARPTSRVRVVADDRNQGAAPGQNTIFRYCYQNAAPPPPTAASPFGAGIQNPFNPFGARVQMCWRELDLSLSRTAPEDMDLDVERLYWAPQVGATIYFDVFDHISLSLGHAEQRPEPCVGNTWALANLPDSGLGTDFQRNYVWNPRRDGNYAESAPAPHDAITNTAYTINAASVVREPTGINRFIPLPELRRPYFVWRDQTVREQGGEAGRLGTDVSDTVVQRQLSRPFSGDGGWSPYIISPWLNGRGDPLALVGGDLQFEIGRWNNGSNRRLQNRPQRDAATGGLLGSIALPLLADFQVHCDEVDLPLENPFRATGFNGWQISVTVQSGPLPAFRAVSGGRPARTTPEICLTPSSPQYAVASGSYNLESVLQPPLDNSLYWVMLDLLKRQTVVTNGFVDLRDPHRVPAAIGDPRLRPAVPAGALPEFTTLVDGPPLPAGTGVAIEFRGAGPVDPQPWLWNEETQLSNLESYSRPDERNVPLDPRKACDAHIRKYDDRQGRDAWTHYYHRVVTDYVEDANTLTSAAFAAQYSAPGAPFAPADLRYVNWRLRMTNAVEATPPVSPEIDSVVLAWRWTAQ